MEYLKKLHRKITELLSIINPWFYALIIIIAIIFPQTFNNIPMKKIIIKVETVDEQTIQGATVSKGAKPNRFQMVTYTFTCTASSSSEICEAAQYELHFPATPPPFIDVKYNGKKYSSNIVKVDRDSAGRDKYKISLKSINGTDEYRISTGIKGFVEQKDLNLKTPTSDNLIGEKMTCSKVEGDNSILICNENPSFLERIATVISI